MGDKLSLRNIFSFCWRPKILGFLLIICIIGLSFMVNEKYFESRLPYLKGKPKYETPSNGNLQVYNLYTKVDEDIKCKKLRTRPPTSVCLYDSSIDIFISKSIGKGGVWEPDLLYIFQDLLREDEELGLLDLGANIGVYSQLAAAMNRSVLAVEPVEGNLKRFAKAVQINGYQNLVTVLPYAVTDIRTKLSMSLDPDNQGAHKLVVDKEHDVYPEQNKVDVRTIFMDDIEPFVPFKKAIMKVDIEGQEHKAFVHSKALMDKVEFPYIFMEWKWVCKYNTMDGTEDKSLTVQLIDLLTGYGYTPFKQDYFQKEKIKLKATQWGQWPSDIIWSKRDK